MIKEYILKHKDNDVLLFRMDNESHILSGIEKIINAERLPFGLLDINNIVECSILLNKWIEARGLPESRIDKEDIKKQYNAKELKELMVKAMGLNLTDHYWLHEAGKKIKWKEVNHFENSFDKVIPSEDVYPGLRVNVGDSSPNLCVDGSIEKRWIMKNEERYLIKGSRFKERKQEPFNEAIASEIMDEYGIKHVRYEHKWTRKENEPYSECLCMCDIHIEYMNIGWVFSNIEYGSRKYSDLINLCRERGIEEIKERIDEMLAIDFLLGNTDRHRGNYGILRESDSLKWICFAPIFDNGNSLFHDMVEEDTNNFSVDSFSKAFNDRNMSNLDLIDYPQWYNEGRSDKIVEIVNRNLRSNEKMKSKRINKIISVIKERIKIFEKIIREKR